MAQLKLPFGRGHITADIPDGRLAGVGSHEQLLESCPVYREICLSQLSEEEVSR